MPGPLEPFAIRAAHALYLDAKQGLLSPQRLATTVESLPENRRERLNRVVRGYGAYETAMELAGLLDGADVWREVGRHFRKGLPRAFATFTRIEVHGFHDVSPLQRKVLVELAGACERADREFELRVPSGGSPEADAATESIFSAFEATANLSPASIAKDLPDAPTAGSALAERFFNPLGVTSAPSPRLELAHAATPREEARHLARRTRRWLDEGVAPERLAVAYPNLGPEARWVRDALSELGVPSATTQARPLVSTLVARVAVMLPRLIADGFPVAEMSFLLGCPSLTAQVKDPPVCAGAVLEKAGVRDNGLGAEESRGAYEVRLRALEARLTAFGRSAEARSVRTVLDRCERVLLLASFMPAEGRWADLIRGWWRALLQLGLKSGTTWDREEAWAFEALQAFEEDALESLAVSGLSRQQVSRTFFAKWLTDALSDFALPPEAAPPGAVAIIDLAELPGTELDGLCVGGLTEGRMPRSAEVNPLFGDEERAHVNRTERREVFRLCAGDGPLRDRWFEAEGRLLLGLAVGTPTVGTLLTFARRDDAGTENVGCSWVEAYSERARHPRKALPAQGVPPLPEVMTERELRERVALERLPLLEPWRLRASQLGKMETERARFFSFPDTPPGPFTGRIDAPELAAALAAAFSHHAQNPVSASTLGRFGNCSFQGFLEKVLKLRERERPGESMDPRGRGSYWHLVLERLFPALAAQGLLQQPVELIPDELLDRAFAEASKGMAGTSHLGHPALWKIAQDRARAMVRRLLATDHRGLPFEGLTPWHAELTFGTPDAPEAWRTIVVAAGEGEEAIHLKGKVDRVDHGAGRVGVVDYKAGKVDGRHLADRLFQTEFQLATYLFAMRAAGHTDARAAWISLRAGEVVTFDEVLARWDGIPVDDLLTDDVGRRAALALANKPNLPNALHGLLARLRGGEFAMRSVDCEYCEFQSVCRISERRVAT